MTDNEKREIAKRLRTLSDGCDRRDLQILADELDPQPKGWPAKWPEHRDCLVKGFDDPLVFTERDSHRLLYTGVHKLNMIPHDGGPCPVDADQTVFVRFCDGDCDADMAKVFRWSHVDSNSDITHYCPIDPVRVDV